MWDDQSFDTNSLSVESWLFAGAVLVAALWRTTYIETEARSLSIEAEPTRNTLVS